VIGTPDIPAFVDTITLTGFSGTPTFVQLVANVRTVEVYQITGGSAGAQSCTVTWNAPGGTPLVLAVVAVQVMNGVGQTTPVGNINTASGLSNAPAVTVPGTTAGSLVCSGVIADAIVSVTATATGGATQNWTALSGTAGTGRIRGAGSHLASPGGGVAMTWTLSGVRAWLIAGDEWLEPPVPPSTVLKDIIRSPGMVAAPI